jgi:hypothetical protein
MDTGNSWEVHGVRRDEGNSRKFLEGKGVESQGIYAHHGCEDRRNGGKKRNWEKPFEYLIDNKKEDLLEDGKKVDVCH